MSSSTFRSTALYVVAPLGLAAAVAGIAFHNMGGGTSTATKHNSGSSVASQAPSGTAAKFACPVALPMTPSNDQTRAIDRQAQKLMGENKFEKALASYRDLAKTDPAFPGVNLDLSMALSKLNQPQPAKQAIDAQLAISMCLAQLFPNELEPYCKAEGFASTATCVKEIGSVQQSAYIQAALVQMDVDHSVKPGSSQKPAAAIQVSEVKVPKHLLIPSREPAKLKTVGKLSPNSLASGDGTDAALGAYSK